MVVQNQNDDDDYMAELGKDVAQYVQGSATKLAMNALEDLMDMSELAKDVAQYVQVSATQLATKALEDLMELREERNKMFNHSQNWRCCAWALAGKLEELESGKTKAEWIKSAWENVTVIQNGEIK